MGVVIVAVPLLAIGGAGVKQRLSVGGFVDPSAESTLAAERLEAIFGTASPNYVLVATAVDGDVLDSANAAVGRGMVERLEAIPGVLDVVSPWTLANYPRTPVTRCVPGRATRRCSPCAWPGTRMTNATRRRRWWTPPGARAASRWSPPGRPR